MCRICETRIGRPAGRMPLPTRALLGPLQNIASEDGPEPDKIRHCEPSRVPPLYEPVNLKRETSRSFTFDRERFSERDGDGQREKERGGERDGHKSQRLTNKV